jgi:putative peptidoglycan lipid II flippase
MKDRARHFLSVATQRQTVGGAAMLISGAFLVSRLLGLFRDRLLVAHFGIGSQLDAYNAAFRLPELLFTLLVSGAFAVAFIPVLSGYLQKDEQDEAWLVTASILNLLVLATVIGGIIMAIFASPLTTILTPGFSPEQHHLAVNLTRIMLITPVFFAISSVLGSVQQAFNRFIIFSLAGVAYNLGIIVGIIFFASRYGVYGVAWGVVLGVILQAALQWVGLYGLGFKWRPMLGIHLKGVRRTLILMVPRSIDQGIDQINYIVETIIASTLAPGSITAFTLANNLKNVPLVLIGTSLTTASFPRMAARAAAGAKERLIEGYVKTARLILFLSIPAAVFMVLGRGYIVRLLYGFGNADTANTLGWFAGTIIFASLYQLVARLYYAHQDTRTPLFVSVFSITLNIILSITLSHKYGVVGLAMAASIVALVETVILMSILHLRQGNYGEREIIRGGLVMGGAGILMAGVLYYLISAYIPLYAADKGFLTLAPKFLLLLAAGLGTYLIPCYLLRLKEASAVVERVRELMVRTINLT